MLLLVAPALWGQPATNARPESPKLSLWGEETTLRGGFGYKDNVLLSSSNPQGSAFWTAGGDLIAFRLPTKGWWFSLFASADATGYLERSTGVNKEYLAIAAAQLAKDLGRGWRLGNGINYTYQDQVFDVSAVETGTLAVAEVRGHTLKDRLFARKQSKACWAEVEADVTRQWLAAPLDSSWQAGPRATVGHSYGHGSDLTLSYQWSGLRYDTRQTLDATGLAVAGTGLQFETHVAELGWHHVWDAGNRWHSRTVLGFEINQDNGAGYFDYRHYRVSEQVKYQAKTWEIGAQVQAGYYDFPVQTIASTSSTLRQKTALGAGVRAEKKLYKDLRAFVNYGYDRSLSNLIDDRYQANTTSAGLEWHL